MPSPDQTAHSKTTRPIKGAGKGTVLVCTASHPSHEAGSRFAGRLHGVRLQHVPFVARATYRDVRDWSDSRPGCLIVRCSSSDCRAFSEYEILGPVRTALGAFFPSQSSPGAFAPDGHGVGAPSSGAENRDPLDPVALSVDAVP